MIYDFSGVPHAPKWSVPRLFPPRLFPVQEDVEVIRAIRSAVGSSVAIMVDYNQCLKPSEAVQRLRLLDDEGLTWVEEPTLAHDYAGHALIARETKTPIQCGENWWGTLDMRIGGILS